MFTQIEIKSNFTSVGIYAPAGVEVAIISFSHPVYICEYDGKRFPCHMDKLGKTKPGEQMIPEKVPEPKKRDMLPDPSRIRRKLTQNEQIQLEYLKNERLKRDNGK